MAIGTLRSKTKYKSLNHEELYHQLYAWAPMTLRSCPATPAALMPSPPTPTLLPKATAKYGCGTKGLQKNTQEKTQEEWKGRGIKVNGERI